MEVLILVQDSTHSVIQGKLIILVPTRTGNNGNPTRTVIRKHHCRDFLPYIPANPRLCQNLRSSQSLLPPIPANIMMVWSLGRELPLLRVWKLSVPLPHVSPTTTTQMRASFDAELTLGSQSVCAPLRRWCPSGTSMGARTATRQTWVYFSPTRRTRSSSDSPADRCRRPALPRPHRTR
jgi:hypothetical protein